MMMTKTSGRSRAMIALAAVLIFAGSAAEARMGGRGSFGSRGSRTWSAPPSTSTAPGAASPIQRSQVPNQAINRPAAGAPMAAQPRRFGFGTGLMAGLFGAGLFGMLMGNGFFGGLAGLASVFGLSAASGSRGPARVVCHEVVPQSPAASAGLCPQPRAYALYAAAARCRLPALRDWAVWGAVSLAWAALSAGVQKYGDGAARTIRDGIGIGEKDYR